MTSVPPRHIHNATAFTGSNALYTHLIHKPPDCPNTSSHFSANLFVNQVLTISKQTSADKLRMSGWAGKRKIATLEGGVGGSK